MTELVIQRATNDCFLCCLVMATGRAYEEAAALWGPEFVADVGANGLYGREKIDQAFAALGLVRDRDWFQMMGPGGLAPKVRDEFAARAPYLKNTFRGRRVLVQVTSKNFEGKSHMLYWDGAEVFDPSPLKTYTWNEADPEHFWLFREVP